TRKGVKPPAPFSSRQWDGSRWAKPQWLVSSTRGLWKNFPAQPRLRPLRKNCSRCREREARLLRALPGVDSDLKSEFRIEIFRRYSDPYLSPGVFLLPSAGSARKSFGSQVSSQGIFIDYHPTALGMLYACL